MSNAAAFLFLGHTVVAGMEANAITVILFVVVVVFAIPMAIYMEYRGKRRNIYHGTDGKARHPQR